MYRDEVNVSAQWKILSEEGKWRIQGMWGDNTKIGSNKIGRQGVDRT